MDPEYVLLSRNVRCNLVEEEHFGIIYFYDRKSNKTEKIGNDNGNLYNLRSCMKPLQFAAISSIIDYFNLSDDEIAVACASHVGENQHCNAVKSILIKCGLNENNLLCPPQEPLSYDSKVNLIKKNLKPSAIHNNCSGKHAAILAYCKMHNLPINNYTDINHTVQKTILNFVAQKCEIPLNNSKIAQDGCTLPVLAIPLKNLALGYLNIFTDKNFSKIINAIINNPYLFGGKGRLDSEIMFSAKGTLVAKVGAGNLCIVVDIKSERVCIIKLIDGDNFARAVILTEYLFNKHYFSNNEMIRLRKIFPTEICDEKNKKLGSIEFLFK